MPSASLSSVTLISTLPVPSALQSTENLSKRSRSRQEAWQTAINTSASDEIRSGSKQCTGNSSMTYETTPLLNWALSTVNRLVSLGVTVTGLKGGEPFVTVAASETVQDAPAVQVISDSATDTLGAAEKRTEHKRSHRLHRREGSTGQRTSVTGTGTYSSRECRDLSSDRHCHRPRTEGSPLRRRHHCRPRR